MVLWKYWPVLVSAQQLDSVHVWKMGNALKLCSNSCVDTMQGPQIPKVDLKMMFTVGEQRVVAARAEAIRNLAFESLRQIGDVVMKFGSCVKTCFVEEQNADGFCYDKKQ
ncbi:unnamed protein product [Nippostrongylus brasiliensis]|uniref:Secreted protein n=1 Tax=Nippostrongylus brasiliensis TaxID=27835 RepID=A0A0N4YNK6_NIPBR|nr:unnamed protein product [Nippostrongylus brasiliensis]